MAFKTTKSDTFKVLCEVFEEDAVTGEITKAGDFSAVFKRPTQLAWEMMVGDEATMTHSELLTEYLVETVGLWPDDDKEYADDHKMAAAEALPIVLAKPPLPLVMSNSFFRGLRAINPPANHKQSGKQRRKVGA